MCTAVKKLNIPVPSVWEIGWHAHDARVSPFLTSAVCSGLCSSAVSSSSSLHSDVCSSCCRICLWFVAVREWHTVTPSILAIGRLWLPIAAPLFPQPTYPFGLPHLCREPHPKRARCQGCPAMALFVSGVLGVCRASVGVLPGSRTALFLCPIALSATRPVFTCHHLVFMICSVGATDVWQLQEDGEFLLCAQTAPALVCEEGL